MNLSSFRPNRTLLRSVVRYDRMLLHSNAVVEWPVSRVRTQFIKYFEKKEHIFVKSSPVVPFNDPSLLFTNAGMNQFKSVFTGVDAKTSFVGATRVVNSQKCIRAGGKHNDLDDVGKDSYHHTYFEMLGTWSFGDYFKKEAINWSYDILVNVYKLPPEQLYVSYFGGDDSLGIPCDTEARDLWLQLLPADHVIPFDRSANFWEMGETGPCGPSSEIHFDRIGNRNAASLVNMDDSDVLEIWNLVFMQHERMLNGSMQLLGEKHIDGGMGLERLVSILQGKRTNYDTDVFVPLFHAIDDLRHADGKGDTSISTYNGKYGADDALQNHRDTAYRVIADHCRCIAFAIADGALPSNDGRGYVLRRMIRRAVRYGYHSLGLQPGFICSLLPVVGHLNESVYPEVHMAMEKILLVVGDEEKSFAQTLDRGTEALNELMSKHCEKKEISGKDAFFLHDSLGFPVDLTKIIAAEQGWEVNIEGFDAAMACQKALGKEDRRHHKGKGDTICASDTSTEYDGRMLQKTMSSSTKVPLNDLAKRLLQHNVSKTDDTFKYFHVTSGADDVAVDQSLQGTLDTARLLALCVPNTAEFARGATAHSLDASDMWATIVQPSAAPVKTSLDKVNTDTEGPVLVGLVFDRTIFYAEAGGQIADIGSITIGLSPGGAVYHCQVVDVQNRDGYVMHICHITRPSSTLSGIEHVVDTSCGIHIRMSVDLDHRVGCARHHTMTHILHACLSSSLNRGDEISQKGSLVTSDKLRFDFSYNKALTSNEVCKVQQLANQVIDEGWVVSHKTIPLKEALGTVGLKYLDGEVYPDPVRTLAIAPDSTSDISFATSLEFCGGTHLHNACDALSCVIMEESSSSLGVRRIVAISGNQAMAVLGNDRLCQERCDGLQRSIDQYGGSACLKDIEDELLSLKLFIAKTSLSYSFKAGPEAVGRLGSLKQWIEMIQKRVTTMKTDEMNLNISKELEVIQRKLLEQQTYRQDDDNLTRRELVHIVHSAYAKESKAIRMMLESLKKATSQKSTFMLIVVDIDMSTVSSVRVAAYVSPSEIHMIHANTWMEHIVSEFSGGKGGGSSKQAQGSIPASAILTEASLLNDDWQTVVVQRANKFVKI